MKITIIFSFNYKGCLAFTNKISFDLFPVHEIFFHVASISVLKLSKLITHTHVSGWSCGLDTETALQVP